MLGGSPFSGAVPTLSTAAISLASCPRQSMQGQEWRKEVQRYLLFRGKKSGFLVAWDLRFHDSLCSPGSRPVHGGAGQCSRSQGGDQDPDCSKESCGQAELQPAESQTDAPVGWGVTQFMEWLPLLTAHPGDAQG